MALSNSDLKLTNRLHFLSVRTKSRGNPTFIEPVEFGPVLTLSRSHFMFEKAKALMKSLKKLVLATLLSLVAANFVASPALATTCTPTTSGGLGTVITGVGDCTGDAIIPKEITSIAQNGLRGSSLTSVTFEAGSQLTSILGYAFYQSYNLRSITLPSGLQTIGDEAFYYNTELVSINIPNTVTDLGNDVFNGAAKLSSVTFEAGSTLTNIKIRAFQGTGLQSILIPGSVSNIQSSAFANATSLKAVVFEGAAPTTVHVSAFNNIGAGAVAKVFSSAAATFTDPYFGMALELIPVVTFDAQSGSTVTAQETISVASAPVTNRSGYNFLGWFDAATGGTQIAFPYAPSLDTTIYAQWQQITYNVTFDAQSGTSVALQNTASVATSPTTTQSGFTFQGWFDAATGGNEITFPYAPSADVTLYAQWVSATPPTPAPYTGSLPTGYSNTTPSIGDEVVVSGLRLNLVTSCTIDGVAAQITKQSADSFAIVIPAGLEPGLKDLVISSTAGTLTAQGAFTVESKPIIVTESPAVSSKANAGSFNGYVAVYAKGHKGKTLAWKIAGKWFKTTITSDYQVFQRKTAAVGLDVDVHLFIDGEKQLTKTVTTR